MNDGSNTVEIAKNIGIIASIVGFLGTAIKVGQWKGEHDIRLKRLEDTLADTVKTLSRMDERVDGIERELLQTMTSLQKDVEYIKRSIDEVKAGRN
jgi:uncharacterized protein YoxC